MRILFPSSPPLLCILCLSFFNTNTILTNIIFLLSEGTRQFSMKFCCGSGVDVGDFDFLGRHNRNKKHCLTIDLDGMMVPSYDVVPRATCRLLTLAWQRQWQELVVRCKESPEEAFVKTEHSGRTALHLATFNEGCPMEIAVALLRANRHAIIVEDFHFYTPLHNLGFFSGGDKVMQLFCDTAMMVEQELHGKGKLPTPSRTSPLYLAAKRNAPTSTLRILMQTRSQSVSSINWIAPIVGGESYFDPQQSLDKCSSPLEILLRGRASCLNGLTPTKKDTMRRMALQYLSYGNYDKDGSNYALSENQEEDETDTLVMWGKCLLFLSENVRTTTLDDDADDDEDDYKAEDGNKRKEIPSLVHTVASLKVPVPVLLQVAMDLFPDQVTRLDDTDNYPLGHILRANHPYATPQLVHIILHPTTEINNSPSSFRRATLSYVRNCVILALENGLSWGDGLQDIIMTNSDVLCTSDTTTGLVPALFAASTTAVTLDTLFLLLLAEPQVVGKPRDI